ncbi:peptide-methionine (S)-S-oxide reductase MsrA [Alteromonas sp. a30]|uniref:peptide-methionine (S)-S-oxide reductase MsrA n=1 Tax=Alteromonas sp. a30 TaxID=2730917 RepID=UPI002281F32B|nr:peptide-methionine (S)-S-oxide reductase MsrA [Alteromonas sp. a30]MCY7295338.1 peptide-methionine (S)-S-oxide reductase MsrA [Alteromonas sp. a30]
MKKTQQATLAGGCFWCIEAALNSIQGVKEAISGYAGGHVENPSYEAVCKGDTGHAEVVRVEFNPEELSYRQLLEIFFSLHNPTQVDRQGNDIGPQYRSAIFYHGAEQKQIAQDIIKEIEEDGIWDEPVVTEVVEIKNYYPAEGYHQDYFTNNPQNQYCNMVVAPKLAKFKKTFAEKLKV